MSRPTFTIPAAKLDDYLLNPAHVEGWSKARFFLMHGFDRKAPEELAQALFEHVDRYWPGEIVRTRTGVKHRVVGLLKCPDGKARNMLVVWKIDNGQATASLVTARPA